MLVFQGSQNTLPSCGSGDPEPTLRCPAGKQLCGQHKFGQTLHMCSPWKLPDTEHMEGKDTILWTSCRVTPIHHGQQSASHPRPRSPTTEISLKQVPDLLLFHLQLSVYMHAPLFPLPCVRGEGRASRGFLA